MNITTCSLYKLKIERFEHAHNSYIFCISSLHCVYLFYFDYTEAFVTFTHILEDDAVDICGLAYWITNK